MTSPGVTVKPLTADTWDDFETVMGARDTPPGVVGYLDAEPAARCAFGDRSDFPRMLRSVLMKDHRGDGLSAARIAEVGDYLAETSQTRSVEACPVELPPGRKAGPYTALTGIFTATEFAEVARPKHDRPVMRYELP